MQSQINIQDESGDRKYFTQIPNIIVNHSTAYEQSLYLIMKRLAGENGNCWASLNWLAHKMGADKKSVSKTIKKLLDRKWIKEIEKKKVKGGWVRQFVILDLWRLNIEEYESKEYKEKIRIESGRQIPTSKESGSIIPGSGCNFLGSGRQTDTKKNYSKNYEEERELKILPSLLEEMQGPRPSF